MREISERVNDPVSSWTVKRLGKFAFVLAIHSALTKICQEIAKSQIGKETVHLQKKIKKIPCSNFLTIPFQGITVPREDWYWPKPENEEEEDCLKEEEEERNEDEDDIVDLTVCIKFNIFVIYNHSIFLMLYFF